jgi:hypothetical protein
MLKTLYNNRKKILEGITNNVFKKEHVEQIAAERLEICKTCSNYDETGEGCMFPGSQPCCNIKTGGCGCSLTFKTRSLSSECPLKDPLWKAVLSDEEENKLKL